ncbi:hypothetical protein niasHS_017234 [Heterodera schachtii]|uniref:DNA-directed DNA polymerase n=1 Tax=Heterodera schachtii TaxID=97005 RepID=A0ABD2HYW0_HETSC
MSQYSDDSQPPILDGPYSPVGDGDNLMDDAPPLEDVIQGLPISAPSPPPEGENRPGRKEPSISKELDPEQFEGEGFSCLAAAQAEAGRFKAFRFIGQFLLSLSLTRVFPEEILRNIFNMCLNYAAEGAESMKLTADHFVFLLTSKHLDYEIAIHLKKLDHTATDKILSRFEMVDQSNKSKERPSIRDEPFVIDITAIESKGAKPKKAGKGRRDLNVIYRIAEGATYGLQNTDNLCLFRAFEFLRMKFVLPQQRFSEYKRDEKRQLENVQALCRACNIDMDLPFYCIVEYGDRIQEYYQRLHPGLFWLYCFETSGRMKPSWKSCAGKYEHELCVLFTEDVNGENGHYDPIKSIGKLFNTRNYCFGDQDKTKGHVCGHKFCKICLGFHAPRDCYITYQRKVKKDKRIIFFDFECTTDFKPDPQLARFKHQVNFCFAHVTCTRCIEKGVWDQELERACALCGRFRTYSWAPFEYWRTDVECANVVDDPLASFTKWLLNFETEVLGMELGAKKRRKRKNAKNNNNDGEAMESEEEDDVVDVDAENNWMLGYDEAAEKPESVITYAYAHAGSRYDHVLIYGEMLRMGVRPELIRQGNHLLEMKARKRGVITTTVFRDSYKLIPIKLASFVKTFDLEIEGVDNKKYFPHKYNKAENYGTVLDTLPPMEDYYPGGLFPAERTKFEQWYEENRETEFDLCEVIADYCKTDVQILAHGLVKMRHLFLAQTKHDITDSITIPSACMKFFVVLMHCDKERIAIIPHLGYEKRGKQSTVARKYLKWRSEEEEREFGRTIRHVESPGGEFKYGNYSLDGMVQRPEEEKDLAIEVNGCYWHACPRCFQDDMAIVGGGETAGAIRARDAKRTHAIARDFEVEVVWECEIADQMEDDPVMKAYFDNCPDSGPIDFHDAFFGASGYPAPCGEAGIDEEERERRQNDYINKPWAGNKVCLEPNNITPNPGLRYLSKLCLNSLWGRFALRNRLTKTEIVECHAELAKLLNDRKIEISSIDQLTEKFWMVCYKAEDEHVVEHGTSNVAIALWTTSAARVHLLESLHLVYKQENGVQRYDTRLLYMDTDSIFYDFKSELSDPLPGGQQLGELTDDYPNHTIMEFVCAGPKAYGLWLRNNATGEDEYKVKVRGITLDSDACERLTFEKMKDMVLNKMGQEDNNVRFNYPTKNFRITKKGEIFTVPLTKKFNPTVNKCVIRDRGLRVVPFGYSTWEYCKAKNPEDCRCKHE